MFTWTYGIDPNDTTNFGRVLTETEGGTNASGVPAGGITTFTYEKLNQNVPPGYPDLQRIKVRVTERDGDQTDYFFNERNEQIFELLGN